MWPVGGYWWSGPCSVGRWCLGTGARGEPCGEEPNKREAGALSCLSAVCFSGVLHWGSTLCCSNSQVTAATAAFCNPGLNSESWRSRVPLVGVSTREHIPLARTGTGTASCLLPRVRQSSDHCGSVAAIASCSQSLSVL